MALDIKVGGCVVEVAGLAKGLHQRPFLQGAKGLRGRRGEESAPRSAAQQAAQQHSSTAAWITRRASMRGTTPPTTPAADRRTAEAHPPNAPHRALWRSTRERAREGRTSSSSADDIVGAERRSREIVHGELSAP